MSIRDEDDGSDLDDFLASDDNEPKVSYKHRRISSFQVGEFVFKNFVMTIPQSKVEAFEKAYDGLLGIDKNAIVRLKNVENEAPVKSRAIRDSVGSTDILAQTKNTPATPLDESGAPITAPRMAFRLPGAGA